MSVNDFFHTVSNRVSGKVGSPWAFLLALAIVGIWALSGPLFDFSDTWQLVINTSTTIVTFLMVFVIQNTQNRDNKAIQLKLDELVRSVKGAREELVDVEDLTDEEIRILDEEFKKLHQQRTTKLTLALHNKIKQEHGRRHGLHLRRNKK